MPGLLGYRDVAVRVVGTACRLLRPMRDADVPTDSGRADFASDEFAMQVVSAFGEAFNNVTIHGYKHHRAAARNEREGGDEGLNPNWRIDLVVRSTGDTLVVEMTDWGTSYDPAAYDELPAELPERGMGLFIMRSCMDSIEYTSGPPNTLVLKKKWPTTGDVDPRPSTE